jgi:geranylgeranyl diphosphate synthase type II
MSSPAPPPPGARPDAPAPPSAPEARVRDLRERVNAALDDLEPPERQPPLLYDPVRYVLRGGGKRLRPILLLLTAEAFGAATDDALPAALAVEVFHNFTLVHDDVMDHADERRGRPAVHHRWDTGTALLAGDLLLVRAYDLLAEAEAEADLAALMRPFRRMARRLCEGQALDKAFETRAEVSVEEYLDMIDGKTGALLGATLELGGRCGEATGEQAEALHAAGAALGRAFQIQDDLLDLTADPERWGKPVGGDLMEGKKTFLLLRALERATDADRAFFERATLGGGLDEEDIAEARRRMDALGVLDDARRAVARHTEAAGAHLERALSGEAARAPEAAATLRWLIAEMQARLH